MYKYNTHYKIKHILTIYSALLHASAIFLTSEFPPFWGPSLPSLSTCWQVIFCLIHLSVGRAKKKDIRLFSPTRDLGWIAAEDGFEAPYPKPTHLHGFVSPIFLQDLLWIQQEGASKALIKDQCKWYLSKLGSKGDFPLHSQSSKILKLAAWRFPKLRTSCRSTLLPEKLGVLYGSGKCNLLLHPSNTTPSRRDPSQLTFSMMDRFPTSIASNGKSVKLNCQTSPTSRYAGTSCLSWVPQPSEWHSVHERHMRSLSVSIDPK